MAKTMLQKNTGICSYYLKEFGNKYVIIKIMLNNSSCGPLEANIGETLKEFNDKDEAIEYFNKLTK